MSNPGLYSPSIFVLSDCFIYFILSFFQDYSTITNLSNNILRFRTKKLTNKMIVLNPIPAGGGQFDPPCSFFYITQKVLV